MKLFSTFALFLNQANGSHFRGGSYQVIPDNDAGTVQVTFTHAWRRFASGFRDGCHQSDLQTWTDYPMADDATCVSGASCQENAMNYQLTFVDDMTPNPSDQYCYGDGAATMPMPAGPSTYGWESCCWVPLTDDNGQYFGRGNMIQLMEINDWSNTSPTFKVPPIWLIMAGCDAQTISLSPVDADGDRIACRWATVEESGGAYKEPGRLGSLSLDGDTCTVTYTGSLDSSTFGVKPVGLMIEDFDADGNVRSSIPVQFLAKVWTPDLSTRGISYPDWFSDEHEHKDHVDRPTKPKSGKNRGRRAIRTRRTPSYCTAAPTFGDETPADGDSFEMADDGTIEFDLQAGSNTGGAISSFTYQAPVGLGCSQVDQFGYVHCYWELTDEQRQIEEFQFCFSATDSNGLVSDRRCLRLLTGADGSGRITIPIQQLQNTQNALTQLLQAAFSGLNRPNREASWIQKLQNNAARLERSFEKCGEGDGWQEPEFEDAWTADPALGITAVFASLSDWAETYLANCPGHQRYSHHPNRLDKWNAALQAILSSLESN